MQKLLEIQPHKHLLVFRTTHVDLYRFSLSRKPTLEASIRKHLRETYLDEKKIEQVYFGGDPTHFHGASTWSKIRRPELSGSKLFKLPLKSPIPEDLAIVNDYDDHFLWTPARAMALDNFKAHLKTAGKMPPWEEVPQDKWPIPVVTEEDLNKLAGTSALLAAPFRDRIFYLKNLPKAVDEEEMTFREIEIQLLLDQLKSIVDMQLNSHKRKLSHPSHTIITTPPNLHLVGSIRQYCTSKHTGYYTKNVKGTSFPVLTAVLDRIAFLKQVGNNIDTSTDEGVEDATDIEQEIQILKSYYLPTSM